MVPQAPDAAFGLDEREAAARRARHGANTLPEPKGGGVIAQAWRQLVTEPMFLLLLAAAALYLLLGSRAEGLLLGAFALITVALVLVQNQRSRKALDALRAMAAPQARVLRGGVAVQCPAADVVPGDALLLEEGERVAADATLLRASALAVDESLLTGESLPLAKTVPQRVFGSTLVVRGHGIAEVTATGAASEAGRIGVLLNQLEDTPTRLQRDTARLAARTGCCKARGWPRASTPPTRWTGRCAPCPGCKRPKARSACKSCRWPTGGRCTAPSGARPTAARRPGAKVLPRACSRCAACRATSTTNGNNGRLNWPRKAGACSAWPEPTTSAMTT